MTNDRAVLHFSSGFPIVIGLHHVEDYKQIKVSNEDDVLQYRQADGTIIHGHGVKHGYHHYVIATRPRCMFVEEEFVWNKAEGLASGNLEFEVGYKNYKKVRFTLRLNGTSPYPFPAQEGMKSANDIDFIEVAKSASGYPNRLIFHVNDMRIGFFLEPDLLHFVDLEETESSDIFDFRVEYIGVSTGKQGQRDFADRLWNHEKVRAISGEIQRDSPNRQVYCFGYQSSYIIESHPSKFIDKSKILETTLGKLKSAEVLEAALIRYFQPTFNVSQKGFMCTEFPEWLSQLREILAPAYEKRGCGLSVVLAPDCRYNDKGRWKFGGFYTQHTKENNLPTDLITFYLDLTEANK